MKTLTIRNLPDDVADALEREKRRRGESLNQTVIDLLFQGLGVSGVRSNGLARLAGAWSAESCGASSELLPRSSRSTTSCGRGLVLTYDAHFAKVTRVGSVVLETP